MHDEAELHQDEDRPGTEAQLFGEPDPSMALTAPSPSNTAPKAEGREDDPHEHAGDAKRLAHRTAVEDGGRSCGL